MVLAICQAQLWPCPGWKFQSVGPPRGLPEVPWPGSLDSDLHDHRAQHQAQTEFRGWVSKLLWPEIRASNTTHYQSTVNSLVQILEHNLHSSQERLRIYNYKGQAGAQPERGLQPERDRPGVPFIKEHCQSPVKAWSITNLNQNLWSVKSTAYDPTKTEIIEEPVKTEVLLDCKASHQWSSTSEFSQLPVWPKCTHSWPKEIKAGPWVPLAHGCYELSHLESKALLTGEILSLLKQMWEGCKRERTTYSNIQILSERCKNQGWSIKHDTASPQKK